MGSYEISGEKWPIFESNERIKVFETHVYQKNNNLLIRKKKECEKSTKIKTNT